MEQKKGIQLNQAFGAVLTLVLVAVLVIVAIVIFASLQTSFAGTTSVTIVGEDITPIASVAGSTNCSAAAFVVSSAVNGSTGTFIGPLNYTISSAGVFSNLTSEFGNAEWRLNYTYTWGSSACEASQNMSTEFGNYTSLIGLVGTIIFLGLVIGVLVASFAFGGRREV